MKIDRIHSRFGVVALTIGFGVACGGNATTTTTSSTVTYSSTTTTSTTTTGSSTTTSTTDGCIEYGPENTWFHACEADIPAGLAGTGQSVGDIPENFIYQDQFGDEVELYQFYGQVVVLDVFTFW